MVKGTENTVTYCDPPDGWKYGFPKVVPDEARGKGFNQWLIDNGYPKSLIEQCGDRFPCRFWEGEPGDF